MRIGFVTCVQLGLSCIEEILRLGGRIDLLVTLEDHRAQRKSGRVYLDDVAAAHGVPLYKCANINDAESLRVIEDADLDWLFIIGWSQIAGAPLLAVPSRGVLGMHPTLLPLGRGRASIPWAILKGLTQTGVTLFQLDEGVDTGPILGQQVVDIDPRESALTLYDKVARAHVELMREIWPRLMSEDLIPVPQDDTAATVWPGRTPSDGEIFHDMGVADVDRLVRATGRPYPGAFIRLPEGDLTIWAGAMEAPSGTASLPLRLQDGTFYATSYETRAENG